MHLATIWPDPPISNQSILFQRKRLFVTKAALYYTTGQFRGDGRTVRTLVFGVYKI